jgi:hypothetical protein
VCAEKQEKSQPFDIHNYKRRLSLAYRKIERDNTLSSQDKELLTKFCKYLEAMDLNQGRTAKSFISCTPSGDIFPSPLIFFTQP